MERGLVMNQETKLLLILSQVKGILKLVKDNKYEEYFISHLIPVQVELNRQLTNLKQSITIQK
jgi:hypothetical protein